MTNRASLPEGLTDLPGFWACSPAPSGSANLPDWCPPGRSKWPPAQGWRSTMTPPWQHRRRT
jgi:hypothetical protein